MRARIVLTTVLVLAAASPLAAQQPSLSETIDRLEAYAEMKQARDLWHIERAAYLASIRLDPVNPTLAVPPAPRTIPIATP